MSDRGGLKGSRVVIVSILLGFIFSMGVKVQGQVSRSAYFLHHIPVSNVLNPAFHPEYKYYINLPVISSFYMGFESPVTFDQLTSEWEGGDSLYIDRDEIMAALERKNYFSFEYYNELGRIGLGFGKHYLHASIAKVFSTKFSFEKDMAGLFLYGNADERYFGKALHLNETGLNMNLFHQFAIGYSYQISEKVNLGTHLKYLNGGINIWTEKAEIDIYTDSHSNFPITASTDMIINTSSTISSFDNMISQIEGYEWFDLTGNHGFGFDLGLNFDASEKFSLSASVVDLGWIKWQENVKNFKSANPDKEFTFEGFDITELLSEGSFSDSLGLTDTLQNHFQLEETNTPYTSHLNPKIYIGGIWHLNTSHDIGALIRTDIVEEQILPSLTLNYLFKLKSFFSIYGNYSIIANNYMNIGIGASLKVGPVQIYLLNDMAYGLYKPGEARHYNFQFGINFLFKKLEKESFKGIEVL